MIRIEFAGEEVNPVFEPEFKIGDGVWTLEDGEKIINTILFIAFNETGVLYGIGCDCIDCGIGIDDVRRWVDLEELSESYFGFDYEVVE